MAQLVSRKHLFELVKKDGRVEESEHDFSYNEFCKVHAEYIKDGKKLYFRGQLDDGEDKYSYAYEKVKQTWLESKCPPIKFAGRGSSRAAFALAGGKCLKIACSKVGVAQNNQELKNIANSSRRCFTQTYAQANDKSSLLTECCAKATKDDFKQMFEIWPYQIEYAIELIADNQSIDKAIKCLNDDYDELRSSKDKNADEELENLQNMLKFMNLVKKHKTAQAAVIADLFKFYEDNAWDTDELLPGDLTNINNWGLAIRDGELCLVILDAGFSEEVVDMLLN